MDLTTTVAAAVVKTSEPDTETPSRAHQQTTPFTNGLLKRQAPLHLHHHHHHHGHPVVVTYRECLKNHAASIGGHAVDGCGEFMPSPSLNPSDPSTLKCGACGCHRNFHRRDPDVSAIAKLHPPALLEYQPHHRHLPPPPLFSPSNHSLSSAFPHHMLMAALGNQQGAQHRHEVAKTSSLGHPPPSSILSGSARKRFRNKFNQDQKDKMLEFAERVGWKIQKRAEVALNDFCSGIGVEKGVFKVWMHNNKNTSAMKGQPPPLITAGAVTGYADDATRQEIHMQNLSLSNDGRGLGTDVSNSSSS